MTSAGFAFRALIGSAALYLFAASAFAGSLGYPLDDAWIHQTLARNLVERGEWSINPGTPAAVSTAPLWTLLLTPAYLLPIPPLAWTYLLGGLALAWVAWETFKLATLLFPDDEESPGMAALLVPCEWHLIWAGFSGMETPLFAALSLAVLRMGLQQTALNLRHWGVLLTLLVLTRPEGLLLGRTHSGVAVLPSERAGRAGRKAAAGNPPSHRYPGAGCPERPASAQHSCCEERRLQLRHRPRRLRAVHCRRCVGAVQRPTAAAHPRHPVHHLAATPRRP